MGDVTSGCTVVAQGSLAGMNAIIIQTAATVDDGDTIEVDDLLTGGAHVYRVRFAIAIQDPTGTPAVDPMKWTDTNDTITIGGSTDDKRRNIIVLYL